MTSSKGRNGATGPDVAIGPNDAISPDVALGRNVTIVHLTLYAMDSLEPMNQIKSSIG